MFKTLLGATSALVPLSVALAAEPSAAIPVSTAAATAATAADLREPGEEADRIIVTASPLGLTVGETITGTSVVSKEEIARNFQNTVAETIARTPGISSTYFGPAASRPIIRGVGESRIRVLDNGIGAIDASVTSPDHAVAIDPATAERIEIVRGPATLLYGSSASGGVVNVISNRIPSEVPEGGFDASGTIGTSTADNGREVAGAFNAKLGEVNGGSIVLHADGFFRDADDYDIPGFAESARLRAEEEAEIEAEGPGDDDEDEEEAFGVLPNSFFETGGASAGLSWVGDRGFFGVSGTVIESKYGVPGAKKKKEEEEEEEFEEEEEGGVFIDLEQRRFDLAGEYRFDGWIEKATLRMGYADYEHVEFEAEDEPGTVFSNEGWEGRLELVNREVGAFGGTLRGAQGVQFATREFSAIGEEAFVPVNENTSIGLFALQEYSNGPWRVDAGARYEHTEQEGIATDEVLASDTERTFDSFSVSGGVGYSVSEAAFLGVNAFRTERAPSAEELFSNGPHLATNSFDIGDPDLDEEIATGIEATFRYTLDRFSFSVNGFKTSYDNFILFNQTEEEEDELPVFVYEGVDADFTGFEAQAEAELFQAGGIDFHGDIGMDYVRATRDGGMDEDLPRIPPLSAVIGIEARHSYGDVRLEMDAVSEQDDVAANELPTDGYQLLNLYATWRPMGPDSPFALRLTATNLTDEDARVHPSFLKDVAPLRGRNFRFALTADF